MRIDEKIKELSNELPDFLVQNISIYSILSKGIHQLTEEECLDHFDVVSKSVKLLVEQVLEIIKKEKIEEELLKRG